MLELPVETEKQLHAKATAKGLTVKSYVEDLVRTDIATTDTGDIRLPVKTVTSASAEAWMAEHRAIATRHQHIVHRIDDSRESIYAGQGE
jgi:hypothetical protein